MPDGLHRYIAAPVPAPIRILRCGRPPRDLQRRHRLNISALFSILCDVRDLAHDADSHAKVMDNNADIPSLEMAPGSHQVTQRYYFGMLSFPNQGGTRVSSASAFCAPLPRTSALVLNVAVANPAALEDAVAAHDLVISLVLYTHHTAVVQAAIEARRTSL
ncbi:hypothetical protein DFH08DRAFT_960087 [Mycena albidolilacea]|uniref:Uncharacterized protein n=1 Tax=Mycena albidolilacea TaxID=1033008 RepID=A0AAD7ERQ6_9AGAR|nr:hypothetical protein DFH08DRAFT_960087 [Mycena albidolilacea]